MHDFARGIRKQHWAFEMDMDSLLGELLFELNQEPVMSKRYLLKCMQKIFNFLFGHSDLRNTHYYFQTVTNQLYAPDFAVALNESSYTNGQVDLVAKAVRANLFLNENHLKELVHNMVSVKVKWGILTNGYKMYFYQLEDIIEDLKKLFISDYNLAEYDVSECSCLSIDIRDYTKDDISSLKGFLENCFCNCRNDTDFSFLVVRIKSLEVQWSDGLICNQLFYYDNQLGYLQVVDSIYYFNLPETRQKISEVTCPVDKHLYRRIDFVSVQSYLQLSEKWQEKFLEFRSNLIQILDKVALSFEKDKQSEVFDDTFMESFKFLMGYQLSHYYRKNSMRGDTICCIGDECPFLLIFHTSKYEMKNFIGQSYIEEGEDLVLETNGAKFTLWFKGSECDDFKINGSLKRGRNACCLSFNYFSMTFANMYDLFLLSKEIYKPSILEGLSFASSSLVNKWNDDILFNYLMQPKYGEQIMYEMAHV